MHHVLDLSIICKSASIKPIFEKSKNAVIPWGKIDCMLSWGEAGISVFESFQWLLILMKLNAVII
jgi:hypothetical protein